MRVAVLNFKKMNIEQMPIGLFLAPSGEVCVKTEYRTNNRPDCYIVSSGESYCEPKDGLSPLEFIED